MSNYDILYIKQVSPNECKEYIRQAVRAIAPKRRNKTRKFLWKNRLKTKENNLVDTE